MMAEMPPAGQQQQSYPGQPAQYGYNQQQPPPRRGVSLDRAYLRSPVAILTTLAWIFALASFIALEVYKDTMWYHWYGRSTFHEFVVVTSWLALSVILVVSSLQIYRIMGLRGVVMKFLMIANSAIWALLALISSSLILSDSAYRWSGWYYYDSRIVSSLRATAALGILEAFALIGAAIVLVLNVLNVYKQPLFE